MFTQEDLISTYTSDQATEDGLLLEIKIINPKWEKGIFSHITTSLLSKGYFKDDQSINVPNLLDLLNQANHIVRRRSNNFTKFDHFFSGRIELPSGDWQKVFISQNETSKFTIMLPEDY